MCVPAAAVTESDVYRVLSAGLNNLVRALVLACASRPVISLLLIQKFFPLLKSDHNDNYTSVTVGGRDVVGGAGDTLCQRVRVAKHHQDLCGGMWSDKQKQKHKQQASPKGLDAQKTEVWRRRVVECRVCFCQLNREAVVGVAGLEAYYSGWGNYDGCCWLLWPEPNAHALAQFLLIKDIRAGKQCQTRNLAARHKSRYNITAAKHKRAKHTHTITHTQTHSHTHSRNLQRLHFMEPGF